MFLFYSFQYYFYGAPEGACGLPTSCPFFQTFFTPCPFQGSITCYFWGLLIYSVCVYFSTRANAPLKYTLLIDLDFSGVSRHDAQRVQPAGCVHGSVTVIGPYRRLTGGSFFLCQCRKMISVIYLFIFYMLLLGDKIFMPPKRRIFTCKHAVFCTD